MIGILDTKRHPCRPHEGIKDTILRGGRNLVRYAQKCTSTSRPMQKTLFRTTQMSAMALVWVIHCIPPTPLDCSSLVSCWCTWLHSARRWTPASFPFPSVDVDNVVLGLLHGRKTVHIIERPACVIRTALSCFLPHDCAAQSKVAVSLNRSIILSCHTAKPNSLLAVHELCSVWNFLIVRGNWAYLLPLSAACVYEQHLCYSYSIILRDNFAAYWLPLFFLSCHLSWCLPDCTVQAPSKGVWNADFVYHIMQQQKQAGLKCKQGGLKCRLCISYYATAKASIASCLSVEKRGKASETQAAEASF